MSRERLIKRCREIPKFKEEYLPHLTDADLYRIIIEDYVYNKNTIHPIRLKTISL